MSNIGLTDGEQYTFGKIGGSTVILTGTDDAQAERTFRNDVTIETSAGRSSGNLFVDSTHTSITHPVAAFRNFSQTSGTGNDCLIKLTAYNASWYYGIDSSDGNAFKISTNSNFIDSAYNDQFKLTNTGDLYLKRDLYVNDDAFINDNLTVNDELDVDLKLNLLTNNANSAQGAAASNQNIIVIEMSDDQSSGYSNASNGQNAGWIKWNANANEHTLLGWDIQQKKFRHLNYDGSDWQGFNVDQSGNMNIAGAYSSSDIRLKKNINTITGSLDLITQMRGVTFDWKKQANSALSSSAGLIAQEVESIPGIPAGLVDTDSTIRTYDDDGNLEEGSPIIDNKKSINYAALSGYYIEAIKEQQIMIENLKARIEALENA